MALPRLAVFKFASCDGCQLRLLDCEDELLELAEHVELAHFAEASSRTLEGPYDLALVEGSITCAADATRIQAVRRASRKLVTIGACATAGGVQALRNFRDHPQMMSVVYPSPELVDSLSTSTPIAAHVTVDFELRGCPIDKRQLLDVITSYLRGCEPSVAAHATCLDCKMRGNVCVMVARGEPCLGPVTHSGCGALCPAYSRGCYGCFGPSDAPRTEPLARQLIVLGTPSRSVHRMFATFNAAAPAFAEEAKKHGD